MLEVPVSTGFPNGGIQQGSKQVQSDRVKSMTEEVRVPVAPKTTLSFVHGSTLEMLTKETQTTKEPHLIIFPHITSHPCANQPLMPKMIMWKKKERQK